jgi:hypothetical protein
MEDLPHGFLMSGFEQPAIGYNAFEERIYLR